MIHEPSTIWIQMYKVQANHYVHMLQDDKNYNFVPTLLKSVTVVEGRATR